ncbi:unnamed protein product [Cladocopium goreaui]|uniref:SET domain-containing protein n=1 Tax=Cladocopium goreaui TaxID=2562237 RepID=A0A9P1GED1_9DINO|nr:unnamed protein product [Cladocopium goreaui]
MLRKLYRSFFPLSVKLLPGIQLEAQLNRPWLSVAKSTLPNAGMGVFAKRSFLAAAILCKFEGSLLAGLKSGHCRSKAQGQSGGAGLQSDDNRYVLSLCSGGWLLDGAPVARAIREGAKEVEIAVLTPGGEHIHQRRNLQDLGVGCMINHGSRENANAKFVLIKTHRSGMLPAVAFLQATKDIAAGEELFTRYGNAESTSQCSAVAASGDDNSLHSNVAVRTQYRPQQWKIARLLQDFDLKDKKDTTKNIVYYTTSFEPEHEKVIVKPWPKCQDLDVWRSNVVQAVCVASGDPAELVMKVLGLMGNSTASRTIFLDGESGDEMSESDDGVGTYVDGPTKSPRKAKKKKKRSRRKTEFNRMMEEMDVKLDKEKSDEAEIVGEPPVPPPDGEPPYDGPEHHSMGKPGDGIIYLSDIGEHVKLDKRGRPYRVGPDGRKEVRGSPRPKSSYSPEEWKSLSAKERDVIIRRGQLEAEAEKLKEIKLKKEEGKKAKAEAAEKKKKSEASSHKDPPKDGGRKKKKKSNKDLKESSGKDGGKDAAVGVGTLRGLVKERNDFEDQLPWERLPRPFAPTAKIQQSGRQQNFHVTPRAREGLVKERNDFEDQLPWERLPKFAPTAKKSAIRSATKLPRLERPELVKELSMVKRADQKYAGGAVIGIVLLIASLRTFSVAGVLF